MKRAVGVQITIAVILALILLTAFLLNEKGGYLREPYVVEKILLDTQVTIKVYDKDKGKAERAAKEAMREIEKVDEALNYYSSKSMLSKVNRNASRRPVVLSQGFINLLVLCKEYEQKTEGAFNITIAPLMDLWSFGRKEYVPTNEEIKKTLQRVDISALEVNSEVKSVSFKKPGLKIDLGGVAKGYAVDKAISCLKEKGIKSALVTTGSTTTVLGRRGDSRKWQIGIEHPRKKGKLIGILALEETSISTSGDYQQYFVRGGVRYHHILDPKTGMPAGIKDKPSNRIISVTVVNGRSCTEADILSTAIFVMGCRKGMKFIEKEKNLEGVIVTADGKIHISSGLKRKIKEVSY